MRCSRLILPPAMRTLLLPRNRPPSSGFRGDAIVPGAGGHATAMRRRSSNSATVWICRNRFTKRMLTAVRSVLPEMLRQAQTLALIVRADPWP